MYVLFFFRNYFSYLTMPRLECYQCMRLFNYTETYDRHLAQCNTKFHQHLTMTEPTPPLAATTTVTLCPLCGKPYSQPWSLERHLETKHGYHVWFCRFCLEDNISPLQLTEHYLFRCREITRSQMDKEM